MKVRLPFRLEFTSPLHKIAFVQRHFTGTCTTSQLLTILELLVKCVERMDTEILLHSECQGSGAKLLERAWQMELYRVLVMLLPWVVSPDVAKVCVSKCTILLFAIRIQCVYVLFLYLHYTE